MSLWDWLDNTGDRIRGDGFAGFKESLSLLYHGSWRIAGSRLPIGSNIYEHDWDALIILDGCRVDLMESIVDEYSFIESVGERSSVASSSREWLAKTYTSAFDEQIAKTVYVTGNPYTNEILGAETTASTRSPFNPANWDSATRGEFMEVDEVWRDCWDDELGTIPPRPVTDRAIHASRTFSPERLVVHYMQPHQPFIGDSTATKEVENLIDGDCWEALRGGEVSHDDVWPAYRENLRLALDDIELLLDSIDAESVVITADHGNALGEWGIYGHPNGCLHPAVKHVPWVRTTASDSGEYEPTIEHDVDDTTISDRLESLGYL